MLTNILTRHLCWANMAGHMCRNFNVDNLQRIQITDKQLLPITKGPQVILVKIGLQILVYTRFFSFFLVKQTGS